MFQILDLGLRAAVTENHMVVRQHAGSQRLGDVNFSLLFP